MSKLIASFIVFISCGLICVQMNGDTVDRPQTKLNDESLIISDKVLDFSQHKVTFIELGADKCIPCKAMQPVMRELAKEYKGTIQVVFYDVWKAPEYAKKYSIKVIPTQVFMDIDGKEIFRHVGFFAKEDIVRILKEKNIL